MVLSCMHLPQLLTSNCRPIPCTMSLVNLCMLKPCQPKGDSRHLPAAKRVQRSSMQRHIMSLENGHGWSDADTSSTRGGTVSRLSMDADPQRSPPGIQQLGLQPGADLCCSCPLLACKASVHFHWQCRLAHTSAATRSTAFWGQDVLWDS